ncbi:MAG TPA: DinB family protein [Acidimicrobiales bacterium]|nr:DinB family protein [Acidimicrobiales bacterium]
MGIVPDDKDWTWVLQRPCPECGFDVSGVAPYRVGMMITANAASWFEALHGDRATISSRPRPDRWSTLEYACHVRDVFRLYDERLALMLGEDDPLFLNWDQDAAAVDRQYDAQDPAVVRIELEDAAVALADRFDTVTDADWQRTGRRSDGVTFTIESFALYLLHDPIHHLWDVLP